ncbi:DUF6455 family protein [Salinarimonas sp.]|uniref:DUF6455 family protein n=1 Tax=Salinarimonas sp. TaxID=2766526 RepID=UPI0032D99108
MSLMVDLRSWWASRTAPQPLRSLSRDERDALARDVGLDVDGLERIAARGPQAGRELGRMLAALGIDAEAVRRRDRVLMRDMSATCSRCLSVRACRRHLDRGVARAVYQHVCPNAASLAHLEARSWWGAPDGESRPG